MDNTAEEFTPNGYSCNFCDQAEKSLAETTYLTMPEIKGKKYDCLIGLSGGVDSSYMLHKAVEMGLKPMCYTVDNGYNDPRADENIMRLVETLKVPFYRYNIDRKKFAELQSAFIQAGQKNIEIPTDHILFATTYEMADKYGIKWILSGGNAATESIMPASWGYNARDLVHIKDVYRRMTGKKLTGLPTLSLLKWNYYKWVRGIKMCYLLDHLDYHREEAIKLLTELYGYKEYGDKHQESEFTKWFQNFYLYEKFGIDKRKAHYSSLIVSGQMTRDEALNKLAKSPEYPRLGIEGTVMKYPKRDYREFKTDERLFNFISKVIKKCRF
jgi:PP-loop superfamily ATP-utilizing enzyme